MRSAPKSLSLPLFLGGVSRFSTVKTEEKGAFSPTIQVLDTIEAPELTALLKTDKLVLPQFIANPMRVYRQVLSHTELSLFSKAFEKDGVSAYFEKEDAPSQVLLHDLSLSETITVKVIQVLPEQTFPLHRHHCQSLSINLRPASFESCSPLIETVCFKDNGGQGLHYVIDRNQIPVTADFNTTAYHGIKGGSTFSYLLHIYQKPVPRSHEINRHVISGNESASLLEESSAIIPPTSLRPYVFNY